MSGVWQDDSGNLPALLLLADGRFPSGGHAHSAGMEAAAALEGVRDLDALREFLAGRLATAGAVAAAFAATACARIGRDEPGVVATLSDEFACRTPSVALRDASRRLGRQLLRAGRAIWPHPRLDAIAAAREEPYQPLVFGALAAAAGLGAAHDALVTPATAAVRLLGLDPFAVHATVARFGQQVTAIAEAGAGHAETDPADLPSYASPMLDISAERHATWEVRLFAS